jgi:hypothetical protein
LSEGMWITGLCHTEMVDHLAALRTAVSSAAEFVLSHSPNEAFRVEVVDELVTEFQKQKERRSCHENPDMRVCDLILGEISARPG